MSKKRGKHIQFNLGNGKIFTINMTEKQLKANNKAGGFMMLPKEIINEFEDKYCYNPNILWFDRNEFNKGVK